MRIGPAAAAWRSRVRASTLAIVVVTIVAALLRLISLGDVPGNPYYDAAVRSMGQSWHNFFFAAFEPSARLGLDKPPVDLWFQVASVKLFGFHSFALKLPEALAGTAAVVLVYDLVRRVFGFAPALVSAIALAVLPVSVLTSRSDTMDSLMTALIVLAAWLVVRNAETGRARYLNAAAAVLGVAFNVKLFQALIPLPALGLLYLMASPLPRRRRLEQGVVASLVLVAVSLSWLIAVSLTPAADRPFAIGSRHGSVWDAAFVFNGVHRLEHRAAGTGPAGPPSGSPSATRLISGTGARLGRRVGSELVPAVLFGGFAIALALSAGRAGSALRRALAASVALWLAIGFIAFSVMSRLEVRYLETMAPAIAIALGIGVVSLARSATRRRSGFLLAALGATTAYLVYLSRGDRTLQLFVLVTAVAAAATVLSRPRLRELPAVTGCLAVMALLAVPVSDSVAIVHEHRFDHSTGGGYLSAAQTAALSRYLRGHRGGERYEAAVSSVWQASNLVVTDDRPVLATRNVDGAPLLSVSFLRDEVGRGALRFVLVGKQCMVLSGAAGVGRQPPCPPASRWAQAHGRLVPGLVPRLGLYQVGAAIQHASKGHR
jgi:4-amino-4-deoxy-L-arabinose transferase-like glycosyltransferase